MFELGKFNLQLAFATARPLREDVEDQRRPVEHPQAKGPLQVALLGRRQGDIEDHEPGVAHLGLRLDLLDLSAANKVRGVGTIATHGDVSGRRQAGGYGQLRQFFDGFRVIAPSPRNADEEGPLGAFRALALYLEDGQESDSALRLTGRAGTTVEIACL